MTFVEEKFIQPLCKYYTLEGTLVYGLALIAAVWGSYKLLNKLKVKIDKRFFLALLPFIVYGGWARALRDHGLGIYGNAWWWCSPPIYFIIFGITLASLLIGIWIEKRWGIGYEKVMWVVAGGLILYNLSLTQITNVEGFLIISSISCLWAGILYLFSKFKSDWLSKINAGILWSHLLDASSSFTAMQFYGYYEQHVLPSFLVSLMGPWVMFPLKLLIVWAVLLAIDKESDIQLKNFLKIIVLILGLALGIRDWLTVSMLSF